ncbi:MAG: tetratricopeptide repeat protein [Planctomycetaceae bacterium]|nr:tetratricopeptide repeat protein [Planctomycetaceae bacterium]
MSAKEPHQSGSSKQSHPAAPRRPSTRKRSTVLNLRVVVWTLIGLVAGGGGAWLWHAWQVRDFAGGAIEQGRQLEAKATDLTDEAEQLVAQGKVEKDQGHSDQAQKLFQKAQGRAEEAFKARQGALQYYLRYAELNPDDPQGPAALARLSQETGNLPAAVEWYATALRAAKNQSEPWPEAAASQARRAELLVAWGQAFQRQSTRTGKQEERDAATARLREAQEEAAAVLTMENIDPETRSKASRALALALLGLHDLDSLDLKAVPEQIGSVGEVLQQAFQQNPADGELALALARLYRQFPELLSESQRAAFGAAGEQEQKRQAAADQVMRQLVDTAEQKLGEAPDSREAQLDAASARISRCQYLARYELPGADSDLQRALELAPNSAAVNRLAGWDSIRKAEALEASQPGNLVARQTLLQKACEYFQAAKDAEFGDAYVYLGLADAQQRLGKTGDAVATLELGLQNVGKTDWSLGVTLIDAILRNPRLTDEQTKQLEQLFENLDDGLTAGRLSLSELVRRSREAQRDVLRARWLAQSNDFAAAADLLVRVLTDRSLAASGQAGAQTTNLDEARARLLLARCYEAQARKKLADAAASKQAAEAVKTTPDAAQSPELEARTQEANRQADELVRKAVETYHQLARDLPGASQLREAAGRLFLDAGQPDMAVLDLQQAIDINDSIGLRFLLARARLEQAKTGGDSQHLVEAAENELNELEKRLQQEPSAQPWAVDLLRAELRPLKAGDAKENSEQALALLRKTEQDFPLSADLLNLLVSRYQTLVSDNDVKRVSALLEIARAFAEGRPADAAVPEDMLKNLVGQDAPLWRFCRANRLLMEPAANPKQQKDRIAEARGLAEGLLTERPDWPQAHLLSASVQRAEGNLVGAVASLEKACDLQPANLRILDQLVRMQLQLGHADQAEARLAKAREIFPNSDALLQLDLLIKRSAGDRETAVKLAREEVARQPAELAPRMRLATLLQEAGQTDEAEKLFREALLIQPDNPAPMTALFALYGQTDKKEQAEAMLQELASNEKLEPYQKALVLARGHEALGQSEQAEKQYAEAEKAYRTAIEAKPADVALRLQLIDLLLRGDDPARFDAAEQEVDSLLQVAPDSVDAKRAQVRILWSRNQGDDRQRALALSQTLSADRVQFCHSMRNWGERVEFRYFLV